MVVGILRLASLIFTPDDPLDHFQPLGVDGVGVGWQVLSADVEIEKQIIS
jgi:hypothetical protein